MSIRPLYPRELVLGADCMLRLYAEYYRFADDTRTPRDPAFSLFQTIEQERVIEAVRAWEYPNAIVRCREAGDLSGGSEPGAGRAAGVNQAAHAAVQAADEGRPAAAEQETGADRAADPDPALARRCKQSWELLKRGRPLVDAYFAAAGIACRVELMLPSGGDGTGGTRTNRRTGGDSSTEAPDGPTVWDIVLIRSGTGLRGAYLTEAAVVRYCLEQSGLAIGEIYVYFLNKDYADEGDPLLRCARITAKVRKLKLDVAGLVARAREVLAMPPTILRDPEMSCGAGRQCRVCRRFEEELPRHNVYTLHRGGKQVRELVARGVVSIAEIESANGLTAKQEVQWRAVLDQALQVDRDTVGSFLERIEFPIAFLDFEAYQRALPGYPRVAPWQHMPFQFSLHILRGPAPESESGEQHASGGSESPDEEPEWYSFIAGNSGDARAELIDELLRRLPSRGTVFVYGAGFESGVLNALAQQFPERTEELEAVRSRIVDMADPFREFAVYHPEQLGKTSLKRVLPVLTGRSYDELPLADGMQASLAYYFLRRGQVPRQFGRNESEVRSRLSEYCGLDTYALVLLWRELLRQRKSASISSR